MNAYISFFTWFNSFNIIVTCQSRKATKFKEGSSEYNLWSHVTTLVPEICKTAENSLKLSTFKAKNRLLSKVAEPY